MLQSEKELLGIIFNFPEKFEKLYNYNGIFIDIQAIQLFHEAKNYFEKNKNINGFQNYLIDNNLLIDCYVECIETGYIESNFKINLDELLTKKLKREIKLLPQKINQYDNYIDISNKLQNLIDENLIIDNNEIELAKQLCIELLKNKKINRVYSGLDFIENSQAGYEEGELIIIAARPGVGKTSLSIDLVRKQLKQLKIGYFTCEMLKNKIMRLLACNIAQVEENKIKNNIATEIEKDKYINAIEYLYNKNLFISGQDYFEDIISNCKLLKKRNGVDIIYIDHLHHINSYKNYKYEREQLQEFVKKLKSFCKEYKIPVILLAQLNRDVANSEKREPRLDDLKGSGDIEQIADIVLFLHFINFCNDDTSKRIIKLIYAKNRNGEIGNEKKVFLAKTRRFENIKLIKL